MITSNEDGLIDRLHVIVIVLSQKRIIQVQSFPIQSLYPLTKLTRRNERYLIIKLCTCIITLFILKSLRTVVRKRSLIIHCGNIAQTAEHILQDCPLHAELRQQPWPKPSTLDDKLNGTEYNLTQIVEFLKATGLQI